MTRTLLFILLILFSTQGIAQQKIIVFQSDFGLKDGAVASMKGICAGIDSSLKLYDLTHEIPVFNIWEAGYRLHQTVSFWPSGTVFVSVVDPGVGTGRRPVVMKTGSGHYIVTPDNGTLTFMAKQSGYEVREIDETINRRPGSSASYTFHGRDVFAYTAGRLAAGKITHEQVGRKLDTITTFPYSDAELKARLIKGSVIVLDQPYGNVWTNISSVLLDTLQVRHGDNLNIRISKDSKTIYEGRIRYSSTFGDVPAGSPVAYLNSLLQLSLAVNMGNFSTTYHVRSGPGWYVEVSK